MAISIAQPRPHGLRRRAGSDWRFTSSKAAGPAIPRASWPSWRRMSGTAKPSSTTRSRGFVAANGADGCSSAATPATALPAGNFGLRRRRSRYGVRRRSVATITVRAGVAGNTRCAAEGSRRLTALNVVYAKPGEAYLYRQCIYIDSRTGAGGRSSAKFLAFKN